MIAGNLSPGKGAGDKPALPSCFLDCRRTGCGLCCPTSYDIPAICRWHYLSLLYWQTHQIIAAGIILQDKCQRGLHPDPIDIKRFSPELILYLVRVLRKNLARAIKCLYRVLIFRGTLLLPARISGKMKAELTQARGEIIPFMQQEAS